MPAVKPNRAALSSLTTMSETWAIAEKLAMYAPGVPPWMMTLKK